MIDNKNVNNECAYIYAISDGDNDLTENERNAWIKLDEDITPDVWNKVKNCKKFVDDEAMNKLIVNYVNGKQKEDYKNDLFNLLKSFITNINLNSRDPQNIILDSFMRQEKLLD